MPVTFTNLHRHRHLLVPLASGATLRLSPGQTSDEVPDVEIQDSAKIDKLRRQGELDVAVTGADAAGEQAGNGQSGEAQSDGGQIGSTAGGSGDTSSPADGGSS